MLSQYRVRVYALCFFTHPPLPYCSIQTCRRGSTKSDALLHRRGVLVSFVRSVCKVSLLL
jgi:hypothetical protein